MRKGSELVAAGYRQLSRKYRMVGRLPEGKTGLQALEVVDPRRARSIMERAQDEATEEYLRCFARGEPEILELSQEEFAEFYEAFNGQKMTLHRGDTGLGRKT